ncbi:MAG: hypothetical protein LUE92_07570 [Clostridiales bacterium]|nr:hypothetical protein [Clostridiales bacterium]
MRKLKESVLTIQNNEEVGVRYMQAWEERLMYEREAREEGQERVNSLILKLAELGRMDDITRAAEDRFYQEELFREFGL